MVSIRDATTPDVPRLLTIWQGQRDLLVQLDPRLTSWLGDGEPDRVWLQHAIEKQAELGTAAKVIVLAAERDAHIIGFASALYGVNLDTGVRTGKIEHFVVDAHDGSGGVGTMLFKAVRQWAAGQQVVSLAVDVPRYHAVQQAFWRAKGAVVVGVMPSKPIEQMQIQVGG